MKVLFVSSGNQSNNKPSILVYNQGLSLVNEGIEITYFTLIGKGLFGYYRNINRLKKVVSEGSFDVIHAHFGFCGIIACLAKSKQKIVVSLMGSDLLDITAVSTFENLKNRALIFLVKLFSRYFIDFTIVKSDGMAKRLFQKTRHKVIPNGVDFSTFFPIDKKLAREKLNLNQNRRIVLFPANIERKEKNFKLAQEAFDLLGMDNAELLVIYGISQVELNLYYNAADIVLMTSVFEGSPNVIKESLACNKVIVSTDVGDVRKNFENVNGCFITSFDPTDVAKKIRWAFTVNESNGRKGIEYLSSEFIASQILSIYKDLCVE